MPLQVERDNVPALRLYGRAGFGEGCASPYPSAVCNRSSGGPRRSLHRPDVRAVIAETSRANAPKPVQSHPEIR